MPVTLVFDNGAGSLKAGMAGELRPSHTMPNCTAKLKGQTQILVGDETSYTARDSTPISIIRPFDRGYITNWEPEYEVWRRMLGRRFLNVDPSETRLLATEAPFGPLVLQEAANEVVFEEFGFAACYRCPSAALSCYREQMLEEERESALKEELKAKRAKMEEKAAIAAAEAAAKAKAEEEAARAAAAAAAAAAGIVHGRGTRLSTGVLVGGGHTRQRYDPADPDGTMGLASSKRTGTSGAQNNNGNNHAGVQSRRTSTPRSQSKKSPAGSGSAAEEKGKNATGSGGSGGSSGGGGAAEDSSDDKLEDSEEKEESESEEGEDPDTLFLNFGSSGKKADLNLLLAAHARRGPMSDVCVVVDSGFSFTHIIPFYQGRALHKSALRLNVGGKLLTNHLKEVVSYRQWNMMDEFELMQEVKEALSYVSLDFDADLRASRWINPDNKIVREFVLPDRKTVTKGYARGIDWGARMKRRQQEQLGIEDDAQPQVLTMGNERFHVPEVLFHPSNIGLRQMGLSEAIDTCINRCPEVLRPQLYANVLLTGGNCAMPNLRTRVFRDLRASAPEHCEINVNLPDEPALHAWRGGSLFASSPEFLTFAVSKQEYDEFGHMICNMRFADW